MAKCAERLWRRDPELNAINVLNASLSKEELNVLLDALLANPDVIQVLWVSGNNFTDEVGVKIAKFVSISTTVLYVGLHDNRLGEQTYVAMANALQKNTSLVSLHLYNNLAVDCDLVDSLFINALRLNPGRTSDSRWVLGTRGLYINDFERLCEVAERMGHPTLQELLLGRYDRDFSPVRRSV